MRKRPVMNHPDRVSALCSSNNKIAMLSNKSARSKDARAMRQPKRTSRKDERTMVWDGVLMGDGPVPKKPQNAIGGRIR